MKCISPGLLTDAPFRCWKGYGEHNEISPHEAATLVRAHTLQNQSRRSSERKENDDAGYDTK